VTLTIIAGGSTGVDRGALQRQGLGQRPQRHRPERAGPHDDTTHEKPDRRRKART